MNWTSHSLMKDSLKLPLNICWFCSCYPQKKRDIYENRNQVLVQINLLFGWGWIHVIAVYCIVWKPINLNYILISLFSQTSIKLVNWLHIHCNHTMLYISRNYLKRTVSVISSDPQCKYGNEMQNSTLGSDRQYMVVKLIQKDSFEIYKTFPRCIISESTCSKSWIFKNFKKNFK